MNNLNELTAFARDLRDRIELQRLEHIQPLQAQLDMIETQIGAIVCDLATSAKTDAATVSYVKPSVRTTWDGAKLAGYAAAHPEILKFRRETEVPASVRIKYNH